MYAPPVRRAIISVSDKTGLASFAKGLVACGVEIYSTGGTRKHLIDHGVAARDVAEYTQFPEMLDGRVKTLHPKIFGGILVRHDQPEDLELIAEHGIVTMELVVVNLYPFQETIAREGVTREEAIEQIDIGGPSLVRAAAKNHAFTSIVTSAEQYGEVLGEIRAHGATSLELRRKLAGRAFAKTADYDTAIAAYFAKQEGDDSIFPKQLALTFDRQTELRYGENSHQRGAVYQTRGSSGPSLVTAKQLNGKELSYNNLLDLDSALAIVRGIEMPAVTVIKHNNPCGAATGDSISLACSKALAGDPQSAFGGVLGFNRVLDIATAELLSTPGLFIEAIVAPDFHPAAVEILRTRPKWKANVRLLSVGPLDRPPTAISYRQIEGGMLVQEADVGRDLPSDWKVVTTTTPPPEVTRDLAFGWEMVRHVKSNAIVVVKDTMLLGCGAGQMSRVDSVEISLTKAGERSTGAVLASDAFFPFADSIERAAKAGIIAIIQPGGSVRDEEVIAACNQHNIAMIFTGRRHFKH
ncbi:phosphoribosylaminoimidazolecarboxamide formyltransferase/IMP cyclohydrolase [Pirellula staleyi DSM 6068]|uniref:Bifunctional purine biosynthesis protein PurH n=1 Tax=Pirellula staleyi (strain ATCC 27377 / DSM 6068 / ICPB 4128) TaxID=530564 RepID=D2R0A8_PIRSD|nr:bifunctional phosphoribosylaminoimidazolecarboxamide formyltransferase/IMP cyclohydrolase [Pirellula staleyi]ADB14776.1 phosphoribosylaminoimidazolecarboxamide formyltransferase/IMP cyclohydrolase [Pirellula staleyi DSM 6068]